MKYKPATPKEWLAFDDKFCNVCIHDQIFRFTDGKKPGCEIFEKALLMDKHERGYPAEWVSDNDGSNPRCTNFKEGYI